MMKTDAQGVQPNPVSLLSDGNCDETESAATLSGKSGAKRKNENVHEESSNQSSFDGEGCEPKRSRLETPMYTDEERQSVVEILKLEFDKELQAREEEALLIEERIQRAQRTLQYLCYAVVSDFYSRDKTITQQVTSTRQRRIHPAVKELLAGKHPKDSTQASTSSSDISNQPPSFNNNSSSQGKAAKTPPKTKKSTANVTTNPESSTITKVPRYIPPKPKDSPGKLGGSSRSGHNKVKQRIVIGNVSKWLPTESREDSATHKWMVYVRGPKDIPDISGFVDKVRFFLHPSYRPNDVVEIVQSPFHLSRRGWGEFPVRVQIHFQDPFNKPVDVIHHLKLDRTCSGLQTLGAETIVDVWINKHTNNRAADQPGPLVLSPDGQEFKEMFDRNERGGYGGTSPQPNALLAETSIKSEAMSPPAAPVLEEDVAVVVSSFLQKPSICESSDDRKDFFCTPKKTDSQLKAVLSQSPSRGSQPPTPSSILIPSPSKVLPKPAASGVSVSSPSKVVPRPTTPVVSSPLKRGVLSQSIPAVSPGMSSHLNPTGSPGVSSQLKPVASSGVSNQFQQTSGIVISNATEAQTSVTSRLLVSSPSKALLKPSIPGVATTTHVKLASGVTGSAVSNPSKVLILNRPALVPKPTTTSAIKTEVVLSTLSSNLAKTVPVPTIRPAEALHPAKAANAPKLIQPANSSAKILLPSGGNQILTASGQVIKVISPSKVVQNSQSTDISNSTPNTVKTVQVPSTSAVQNQNALGAPMSVNASKPISLVKYKAPDGSIRFLQVSQIHAARPASQPQNTIRARQVVVRPANNINPSVPAQRNPSPVVRLPAPSNVVAPSQTQGQVLMFRNGKIYLVRPSPANVRQHASQTAVQQQVTQPVSPSPQAPIQPEEVPPLFVPPTTVAPTVPALVNTIRALPTAKLMPEKVASTPRPRGLGPQVVHRQGASLLKSNALQQSPASSPTISPVNSPCASPSIKTISHRVILPKPAISPVAASTYRSKLYKQMLSNAVRSCPTKSCAGGVGRAIRWMVRNLPLISIEARNPEYQILHPYCASDMNTFVNWNLGKQRACEFMRAHMVLSLLRDVGWDESEVWTVREILVWARFHGYTPGLPLTDSGSGVDSSVLQDVCNYKSINEEVADWITKQDISNLAETADAESSDEELDVVSVRLSPSKISIKQEPLETSSNCLLDPVEDMPLEGPLIGAGAFVNQVLNNTGVQLEPEQLVVGVRYPAAQRILVQAVHSLVDDIVRRSLAKAWGPNIARSPRSIELTHVCSAILGRPEFDFLSCEGLGVDSLQTSTGGPSTSKPNLLNPS